jgi:hypothetical protein
VVSWHVQVKGITEVSGGKSRHFGFAGNSAEDLPVHEQTDASTSKNMSDLLKGDYHSRRDCTSSTLGIQCSHVLMHCAGNPPDSPVVHVNRLFTHAKVAALLTHHFQKDTTSSRDSSVCCGHRSNPARRVP